MSQYRTAWYSAQAAEQWGSTFWLAPDGREIELTAVTEGDYFWDDKVSVGPVVRYSRKGVTGKFEGERKRESRSRWGGQ